MVGDTEGLPQGMGDHDDGIQLLEFHEEVFHGFGGDGVEGAGSLVGEEVIGFHGEGAGETQTLLLPDGKACGGRVEALLDLVPEPDAPQVLLHTAV